MNGNDLVNPVLDIDSQYKEINDVYFNTLALDSTSFNSSQLAVLNQLAFECPLIGGEAVFKARAMLSLLEDNIYFDDALCSEPDLRMARVKHDTVPQPLAIKLYPNPAQNYAILQFIGNSNDQMQLKINDGLGNILVNKSISADNGMYVINTSNFSEGIYYVAVYDKTGKIFGEKLCIFMK